MKCRFYILFLFDFQNKQNNFEILNFLKIIIIYHIILFIFNIALEYSGFTHLTFMFY